jgi:hypothetical protein
MANETNKDTDDKKDAEEAARAIEDAAWAIEDAARMERIRLLRLENARLKALNQELAQVIAKPPAPPG